MSGPVEFQLRPLRFDNLLAFLALLGLLRALEAARPQWRVRASWRRRDGRDPWTPVLRVDGEVLDEEAIIEAAVQGLRTLVPAIAQAARAAQNDALQAVATAEETDTAVAGLVRQMVINERQRRRPPVLRFGPRITPFLPKRAAGQQNFLARLAALDHGLDDRDADLRARPRECLFETWRPRQSDFALRWDPVELRPYAERWRDPSEEPAKTVEGAVRLAVLALPWFPLHPGGSGVKVPTFSETSPRRIRLRWPIWAPSARPAAVKALLSHPALVTQMPEPARLRPHGVVEVVQSRVVWRGDPPNDHPNCTRGEPLWGDAVG